jgi:hypothetical protein
MIDDINQYMCVEKKQEDSDFRSAQFKGAQRKTKLWRKLEEATTGVKWKAATPEAKRRRGPQGSRTQNQKLPKC